MSHEQICVKVNAPVDRRIAPLVTALSEIDGLITLDSCEEGAIDDGDAYVFFSHVDQDYRTLADLLQDLASHLAAREELAGTYVLRMEWFGSNDRPRAQITLRPERVPAVALAVQQVAPAVSPRRCQLAGGR